METYIATFFTHFGAVKFARDLRSQGKNATLMPVPRDLSSSCGTCVRFEGPQEPIQWVPHAPELDRIFICGQKERTVIYENTGE